MSDLLLIELGIILILIVVEIITLFLLLSHIKCLDWHNEKLDEHILKIENNTKKLDNHICIIEKEIFKKKKTPVKQ